jgi:hypothetical protein
LETKFSIITWDASFRESFHTVNSFCTQNYPSAQFEFIWVDFFDNNHPELIKSIQQYPNARLLNLKNKKSEKWHLGVCINNGIQNSKGEFLIIPDGDIVVSKDFLSIVEKEIQKFSDQVLYFRRWDEMKKDHCEKSIDYNYLSKVAVLTNPTNYGGCLVIKKELFKELNFYEESEVFAGPGANGLETYIRLRNKGLPIKWHDEKIFHPYHSFTGTSDKYAESLNRLKIDNPWILPYAGLYQSWTIRNRELNLSYKASKTEIESFIKSIPEFLIPKENEEPLKKNSLSTFLISKIKKIK